MFPLQEFKDLIDMITGKAPVSIVKAMEAIAAVLKYAATVLSGPSAESASNAVEVDPVQAMEALVVEAEGGVAAAGILDRVPKDVLMNVIMKFLLNWLSNQLK